jgi:hypothetical protein
MGIGLNLLMLMRRECCRSANKRQLWNVVCLCMAQVGRQPSLDKVLHWLHFQPAGQHRRMVLLRAQAINHGSSLKWSSA